MGKRQRNTLLGILKEAGLQADTVARAFANTSTFGAANPVAAALNSVPALWRPESYGAAFDRNMEAERARDAYDEMHRPAAKRLGEGAAIAAGLLRGQIPKPGPWSARPAKSLTQGVQARLPAVMAASAGVSAGTQTAIDFANGEEIKPARVAVNAIPGAMGAAVSKYGGARIGGAIDGAVGSVLQDVNARRPISVSNLAQAAVAGARGADVGEAAALSKIRNLKPNEKGRLGETLSAVQAPFRGHIMVGREVPFSVRGGHTRADWAVFRPWNALTGGEALIPLESKMGRAPRLRPRQRQARQEYADYAIDHFTDDEVARWGGDLASAFSSRLPNADANSTEPGQGSQHKPYEHRQPESLRNVAGVAGSPAALTGHEFLPDQRDIDLVTRELFRTYRRPDSWFSF